MPIFALFLFLLFVLLFSVFAAGVVYHLKRFEIEPDKANKMVFLYLGVSFFLLFLLSVAFLTMPWSEFLNPL